MSLQNAARLLRSTPLECTPEDLVLLTDAEREEYEQLTHERGRIIGKIRRIQLTAIFRRYLKPEQLARYDALDAEKTAITARLGNVEFEWEIQPIGSSPADPDVIRLGEIGHELNALATAAYCASLMARKEQMEVSA